MKNFPTTILDSIYSPSFYSTASKKSFGSAIGYFLLFILLLTLFRVISLSPMLFVDLPKGLNSIIDKGVSSFPSELTVEIKNGQVTTNVKEPYFIPISPGRTSSPDGIVNFIVIDTKTPFSIATFEKYQAAAWLTKDALFTKSNRTAELKTYSLAKIPNYVINKLTISSLVNTYSPWIKFIGPIAIIGALFGLYLVYLFRLLYLLIISVVIWILSKIFTWGFSYGQSYKVGLYALTAGLIIEFAASFLHWNGFPFMVSIITLGVIILNLQSSPKKAKT